MIFFAPLAWRFILSMTLFAAIGALTLIGALIFLWVQVLKALNHVLSKGAGS